MPYWTVLSAGVERYAPTLCLCGVGNIMLLISVVAAACGCSAGSEGTGLGAGCPLDVNGIGQGALVCHCYGAGAGRCAAALIIGSNLTSNMLGEENCAGCGSCAGMCESFDPAIKMCNICPPGKTDDDSDPTVRATRVLVVLPHLHFGSSATLTVCDSLSCRRRVPVVTRGSTARKEAKESLHASIVPPGRRILTRTQQLLVPSACQVRKRYHELGSNDGHCAPRAA